MDLIAFAESNRYRTRSLADGYPLYPIKGPLKPGSRADLDLAIVGRRGFITANGSPEGRLTVMIAATSRGRLTAAIAEATATIAFVPIQRGDTEAIGTVPDALAPQAASFIRAYRVPGRSGPPANPFIKGSAGRLASENAADKATE